MAINSSLTIPASLHLPYHRHQKCPSNLAISSHSSKLGFIGISTSPATRSRRSWSFKKEADANYQREIAIKISEYLVQHPDDAELSRHFHKTFHPDLVENAFGAKLQFVTKVAELLKTLTV